MSAFPSRRLGLGLLLAAALPVSAADPAFTSDLKLRAGIGLGSEDHLSRQVLSVGINLGYAVGGGKLQGEVGYFYKPGAPYIQAPEARLDAGLSPVDAALSGDSRRTQLDGLSLRLSWSQAFSQDWSWHAGAMLGGTRFKQEFVGSIQGTDWNEHNPNSWRDTYSGTPTKGGLTLSPFAGLQLRTTPQSSLEFNLLLLNYTALDYRHLAGAGHYVDPGHGTGLIAEHNAFPLDRLQETRRMAPHLEFAYVIHF